MAMTELVDRSFLSRSTRWSMNQLEYRRSIKVAHHFLTRCFAPDELLALLLRRENPVIVMQRVVPVERAVAPHYLGWLAHRNAVGANIYVTANPLRSGSRKRTKENVASVRDLYLDIDSDGGAKLTALQHSDRVPKPAAIISTSPCKYPGALAGERLRLREARKHPEATRSCLWSRSRSYRLQPRSACVWLLKLEM
jgi:hypothetical protein